MTDVTRTHFTMIPNIILELGLSKHAILLYLAIKRSAGEEGVCMRSTDTLARDTGTSAGSVSQAKRELQRAGLIAIREASCAKGGHVRHVIRVVPIWERNARHFGVPAGAAGHIAAPPAEQDPVDACSGSDHDRRAPRKGHAPEVRAPKAQTRRLASAAGKQSRSRGKGGIPPGEGHRSPAERHRSSAEGSGSPGERYRSPGEGRKNNKIWLARTGQGPPVQEEHPALVLEPQVGVLLPAEGDQGVPLDAGVLWPRALGELSWQMTRQVYDRWFAGSHAARVDEQGALVIAVRDAYTAAWLGRRWVTPVERVLSGLAGRAVRVRFEAGDPSAPGRPESG